VTKVIARYLKSSVRKDYENNVKLHEEKYRHTDFSKFQNTSNSLVASNHRKGISVQIDTEFIAQIRCEGDDYREKENCLLMYQAFEDLTPSIARSPGIWTYLTHTDLLQYSRDRWLKPNWEKNEACNGRCNTIGKKEGCKQCNLNSIKTHFFVEVNKTGHSNNRSIEINNAASRLWQMADFCNGLEGITLEDALHNLLIDSDSRNWLIENPTLSTSKNVRAEILKMYGEFYNSDKDKNKITRKYTRPFIKRMNILGGNMLLEAMSSDAVKNIVHEEMESVVKQVEA